jgi:hypothetical protein
MEPEHSLLHLQVPTTCPWPEQPLNKMCHKWFMCNRSGQGRTMFLKLACFHYLVEALLFKLIHMFPNLCVLNCNKYLTKHLYWSWVWHVAISEQKLWTVTWPSSRNIHDAYVLFWITIHFSFDSDNSKCFSFTNKKWDCNLILQKNLFLLEVMYLICM